MSMLTEVDRSFLKKARLVSVMVLASPLIYIGILVILYANKMVFVEFDSNTLDLFIIILSILGVFSLLQGFMIPRRIIRIAKNRIQITAGQTIFSAHIMQYALFEVVSIYGLILGFLSVELPIIVAFFIVSLIAMIATFPTEDRWTSICTELNQANLKKY
jgi:hypothetical protein